MGKATYAGISRPLTAYASLRATEAYGGLSSKTSKPLHMSSYNYIAGYMDGKKTPQDPYNKA